MRKQSFFFSLKNQLLTRLNQKLFCLSFSLSYHTPQLPNKPTVFQMCYFSNKLPSLLVHDRVASSLSQSAKNKNTDTTEDDASN